MMNPVRVAAMAMIVATLAMTWPVFAQQQPEPWAKDAVQDALELMKKSGNLDRARKEADEAARVAKERGTTDGVAAKNQLIKDLDIQQPPTAAGREKKPDAPTVVAGTEFRLFISSSMPADTLREYARQVDALRRGGKGVSMVMRGFVGGMKMIKPTIGFYHSFASLDAGPVQEDTRYLDVDFQIDPVKAAEYRVSQAPALADDKGCVVYGDAKLNYLLEQIKAKKCGQRFGAIYQFAERSATDEIQEAAARIPKEKLQAQIKASMENRLDSLPGGNTLPKATRNDSRTIILQASLPFDVPNPKTGEILYPQGFSFNPMDYARLPLDMIVFDGSRQDEIKWVKSHMSDGATLLAMGGDYNAMAATLGRPVYSGVQVAEQGWCRATPCQIKGDQNVLLVTEVVVAPNN